MIKTIEALPTEFIQPFLTVASMPVSEFIVVPITWRM
jgi:hypothetical protein